MGREKEGIDRGQGVDSLVDAAKALGRMLKESAEFKRFVTASDAFTKDSELKVLLESLAEKERQIEEKMQKGTPVEVSEKREMGQLRERTREHPTYAEFLEAQSGYLTLLKKVNDAVNEAAGAGLGSEE